MISFVPIDGAFLPKRAGKILREWVEAFSDDPSVAGVLIHGCLLVRVQAEDGEYAFLPPLAYGRGADPEAALCEIDAYAKKENLSTVFVDLEIDEAEYLSERYRLTRTQALDEEGERFALRVLTEADVTYGLPVLSGTVVTLSPLTKDDAADYGRLCRDEAVRKWYGYDAVADMPEADDARLLACAMREAEDGRTAAFAIRRGESFVGEIVLFDFDGHGHADLAVRVLREYRGCGYAKDAVKTLLAFAKDGMALYSVNADCFAENHACIALLTPIFGKGATVDGKVHFVETLNE